VFCLALLPCLQLSNIAVTATVGAIVPAPPAGPGTCPNATCAFAAPLWVLSNTSSADNTTNGSMYVATYPQVPVFGSMGGTCGQPVLSPAVETTTPNLDGITVAVVPALNAAGVDLRTVQLSIWGGDPFNTTVLPWNASNAAVAAAVDLATGFRPTVTQRR
jgi:hypothetical protein